MPSQEYRLIPIGSDHGLHGTVEMEDHTATSKRPYLFKKFLLTAFLGIASVLLIFGVLDLKALQSERHHGQQVCGGTPEEARDSDCIFDILLMGWVPQRCHNAHLANRLGQQQPWVFHRDKNGTMPPMSVQELLKGDWDFLYVNQAFAVAACAYSWQKMHSAAITGDVLDGYTSHWHHTEHCGDIMTMQLGEYDYTIGLANKFVACPWNVGENYKEIGWYSIISGKKMYMNDNDEWVTSDRI